MAILWTFIGTIIGLFVPQLLAAAVKLDMDLMMIWLCGIAGGSIGYIAYGSIG